MVLYTPVWQARTTRDGVTYTIKHQHGVWYTSARRAGSFHATISRRFRWTEGTGVSARCWMLRQLAAHGCGAAPDFLAHVRAILTATPYSGDTTNGNCDQRQLEHDPRP